MSDNDFIRRGDALKIALAYASGEGGALAEHAIRAIPAADARAEAQQAIAGFLKDRDEAFGATDEQTEEERMQSAAAILALITETKP